MERVFSIFKISEAHNKALLSQNGMWSTNSIKNDKLPVKNNNKISRVFYINNLFNW